MAWSSCFYCRAAAEAVLFSTKPSHTGRLISKFIASTSRASRWERTMRCLPNRGVGVSLWTYWGAFPRKRYGTRSEQPLDGVAARANFACATHNTPPWTRYSPQNSCWAQRMTAPEIRTCNGGGRICHAFPATPRTVGPPGSPLGARCCTKLSCPRTCTRSSRRSGYTKWSEQCGTCSVGHTEMMYCICLF